MSKVTYSAGTLRNGPIITYSALQSYVASMSRIREMEWGILCADQQVDSKHLHVESKCVLCVDHLFVEFAETCSKRC